MTSMMDDPDGLEQVVQDMRRQSAALPEGVTRDAFAAFLARAEEWSCLHRRYVEYNRALSRVARIHEWLLFTIFLGIFALNYVLSWPFQGIECLALGSWCVWCWHRIRPGRCQVCGKRARHRVESLELTVPRWWDVRPRPRAKVYACGQHLREMSETGGVFPEHAFGVREDPDGSATD